MGTTVLVIGALGLNAELMESEVGISFVAGSPELT